MGATAFQRRRRELAAKLEQEALYVSVAGDMTVLGEVTDKEDDRADQKEKHYQPEATEGAIKLAEQYAINLKQLSGTGENGRITVQDVKKAQKPLVVE